MIDRSQSRQAGGFLSRRDRPLILYLIEHREYSGAEMIQVPVMRADVDPLLACPPDSRTQELADQIGVSTVPIPFRSVRHSGGALATVRSVFRALATARDLRRLLRAHPEREVIYCMGVRSSILAALASLGLRRALIWNVANILPPPPIRQATRLLALTNCTRAIALSKALAAEFAGRSDRLRRKVVVVYPGIDVPPTQIPVADRPRAAIVGYLSPVKRTDEAIEIAAQVGRRQPGFELAIVGQAQFRESDFEFERRLKERVAGSEQLARQVSFLGHVTDVASELSRCRLLLHCCAVEGFGRVLVEAMASGLPIVAAEAPGPSEIVQHGVTGFLYEAGNVERAAGFVSELIQDQERARRMGAAGREVAARRFSLEHQLGMTEGLLSAVASPLASRRRHAAVSELSDRVRDE